MSTLAPSLDVQIRSVLIATDFSRASEKPLGHATAVARLFEARLYLLHVVSSSAAGPQATIATTEAASGHAQQLENELIGSGALADLPYEFLVRQGIVWEEVERVITDKHIDLLIVGTHGRRGLGKLVFGSVAEQIFRHADCPVLTVDPSSFQGPIFDKTKVVWPFLFATNFGSASLRALPYAVSFANRLGTKLVLLHIIPRLSIGLPGATAPGVRQTQELARQKSLRRLRELTDSCELSLTPECMVVFGFPNEKILEVAESFTADAIFMGLRRSAQIGTASHTLWTTAYEVARRTVCPVMTVRS